MIVAMSLESWGPDGGDYPKATVFFCHAPLVLPDVSHADIV
jgi:hypothetical protein